MGNFSPWGAGFCTSILNPAVLVPHKLSPPFSHVSSSCSHVAKSYEPRSSRKTWPPCFSFSPTNKKQRLPDRMGAAMLPFWNHILAKKGQCIHVRSQISWYVCSMYLGTKGDFFSYTCTFCALLPRCCALLCGRPLSYVCTLLYNF